MEITIYKDNGHSRLYFNKHAGHFMTSGASLSECQLWKNWTLMSDGTIDLQSKYPDLFSAIIKGMDMRTWQQAEAYIDAVNAVVKNISLKISNEDSILKAIQSVPYQPKYNQK